MDLRSFFQNLVIEAAQLPAPDLVESPDTALVGYADINGSAEALVGALEVWTKRVDAYLAETVCFSDAYCRLMNLRLFTFAEYRALFDFSLKPARFLDYKVFEFLMIATDAQRRHFITNRYQDVDSYLSLIEELVQKSDTLRPFFSGRLPVQIPVSALKRHCYITGATGSGKTELLKLLFYNLQFKSRKKRQHALILIEPHHDLSEQCRDFDLNAGSGMDRLVFIDPYFKEGYLPVLNPFEIKDRSEANIDRFSQELARVFQELIPTATLSLQMDMLLKPCIATLLRRGNGSFAELLRFMDDNNNKDLVALGVQSPIEEHSQFFKTGFLKKEYKITKTSVATKLQSLLNATIFARMTGGKSTLDLEALIDEGKVLIFSLSKGKMGEEAAEAFGRFLLAYLQSIIFKRVYLKESERKPVFLFIDEFQNFVTQSVTTMLTELRKYGLHLIMAQQLPGQNMERPLKEILFSNTAVKLVGQNSASVLGELSKELSLKTEVLQGLKTAQFYLKTGAQPAIRFEAPNYLVGDHLYRMSQREAKVVTDYLLRDSGLYRPLQTASKQAVSLPPPPLPEGAKAEPESKPKYDL